MYSFIKSLALVVFLFAFFSASGQTAPSTSKEKPPKSVVEKKEAPDKKPSAGPFHAKLVAVDKTKKTITVGKRTFQITSETKINKAGKPASLEDGIIGEPVSGYVKPNDEGKLVATKVNFGSKPEEHATKDGPKKKK